MLDLRSLDTPVLVDMLAAYTLTFSKMKSDGWSDITEFESCKQTIEVLQQEISFRQTAQNTSISNPQLQIVTDTIQKDSFLSRE